MSVLIVTLFRPIIEKKIAPCSQCPFKIPVERAWLSKLDLPENFSLLIDDQKLSILINDENKVKSTSQFIVDAFNMRSRILFLKRT